jgi:hypothetical protein
MSKYKELTTAMPIGEGNSPSYFLFAGTGKDGRHNLLVIYDYREMYREMPWFFNKNMREQIQEMFFTMNWPGATVLKSKDTADYRFYLKREGLSEITGSINAQIEKALQEFADMHPAFPGQSEDGGDYIELEILEDDKDEKKQKVFLRHRKFGTICNFIYEADSEKVVPLSYGDITPDDAPRSRRAGLAAFVIGLIIYFALFILPRWLFVKIREIREAAAIERIE